MAIVEILSSDLKTRLELARLLQGLGHQALHASDMADFGELQGKIPPEVLVAVEPSGDAASGWIAEIRRAAPLLPVVVCLNVRSAARALDYLKMGVTECVAPPVTREALAACVRKAMRLRGTVIELADLPPEPKQAPRRRWAAWAVALALLAGALLWRVFSPRQPEPTRSWDLPYLHPAGLAATPDALWVGDWYAQSVYEHALETLAIHRVRSFPQEPPAALAFAEGALWIATPDGRVVKHLLDGKLTVLGRFHIPGGAVVGLCYDGLYLWSADRQARVLRQHLLDDRLTPAQTFPYPGTSPAAIACDRRGLWSIDDAKGEVLRHDLADPAVVVSRAPLEAYASKQWRASGLALAQGRLWSVAEQASGGRAVLLKHSEAESLQK